MGQHTPVHVSVECQTDFRLLNLGQEAQQGGASSGSPVHTRSYINAMTQTGVVSIQHWSEASFCVHCRETRGPSGAMEQMETVRMYLVPRYKVKSCKAYKILQSRGTAH